jgi:hypothetical protein
VTGVKGLLEKPVCGFVLPVILSGVRWSEAESNVVEGSYVVWLRGECPEILRLRKSPSIVGDAGRFATLRMTGKGDCFGLGS